MGKNKSRACSQLVFVAILTDHLGTGSTHATVRCTTWNLEWFPNGSAHDASPKSKITELPDAANVLKPLHPDILLLQEVVTMTHVVVSGMLSNLAHITWKFAQHSRSRFKAAWADNKKQFSRRFQRKRLGRNRGNRWKELTRLEALRLHGSRFEMRTSGFIPFI